MLLNENIKTMTCKKLEGLLMFIKYYFQEKLTYVSLCHKDMKNHLLMNSNLNTSADN